MIELTSNIGDDRRCCITVWKTSDGQALGTTAGLPRPSRIQDHMAASKLIGQSHYFLIEELPRLVMWLETTGRTYRLKNFNEITLPSAEVLKSRALRQEHAERAVAATLQRAALRLAKATKPEGDRENKE
jgi:hypothetical protein